MGRCTGRGFGFTHGARFLDRGKLSARPEASACNSTDFGLELHALGRPRHRVPWPPRCLT